MTILAHNNLFPDQNTLDHREADAVDRVLRRGRLSYYRANASPEFYGGPEIINLEQKWSEKWGSKFSIACNSATSGLHVACGAIGLKPGDEVIVTPWSMTCSATAPLLYGAIPIFADIEKDYFCLDPDDVERKITDRTKAIIGVDLFGQPYDPRINEIAEKHNLYIIEDAAQAVGSQQKNRQKYAGTFGHIGVFSFNFGKHLTCGEGGMIVTDDWKLEQKCRLLMNHVEAVVNDEPKAMSDHADLVGFNMRMTELQAAIASVQLDKFDELQAKRMANVNYLNEKLTEFDFIEPVKIRPGFTHTYYALPFLFKPLHFKMTGKRDEFIGKVKSKLAPREGRDGEGVQIGCGYIKPIYLMPLFQSQKHWAFNLSDHYPYVDMYSRFTKNYKQGSCPTCEKLWQDSLFLTLYHAPNSTLSDMERVYQAFRDSVI